MRLTSAKLNTFFQTFQTIAAQATRKSGLQIAARLIGQFDFRAPAVLCGRAALKLRAAQFALFCFDCFGFN